MASTRVIRLLLLLVAAVPTMWSAAIAGGCAREERFEFTRVCMGVQTRVVLYATSRERATEAAAGAFARISELDAALSDYRASSDLSRVNAGAGGPGVPVGPDLIEVLSVARELARASGGAFNPAIGPAVQLWRRSRDRGGLPAPQEVARALDLCDWREIGVGEPGAPSSVRLGRAGMALDLGGIAKGHAAEEAARRLRALGHPRCLVALAGDIYAGDPPPGEPGWRVTLTGDRGAPRPEPRTLIVREAAVSTSGDFEQYVEIDGARFSHIIDPATGLGSRQRRVATVVAPRGAHADALATAAFLWRERGPGPDDPGPTFDLEGVLFAHGAGAIIDEASGARRAVGVPVPLQ